ncbi:MAG: hypothetical protein GC192_17555 [Bacteroidetes bacterium]|nr:hypothetical protein [Bacteroidota bacterium]
MKLWKKGFSLLLFLAVAWAAMQSFALGKIERNKVIKKDFAGKAEIVALHQYGPLAVKKSPDGKVHLTAEMLLTGSNEAEMEEVLNRFDIAVQESANELRLTTDLGIQSCNTINNRMTIKYKDGQKVKGVNNFKVNMTLEVPNPEKLTLENKFDRIELTDDYAGALRVELYSGDLLAANLGNLDLNLKYGKVKAKNIGKAKLVIYNSEMRVGDVASAEVSSKYSKYELGNVAGDLHLETYDDKWQVGDVNGKLSLNDKYSEFKFENIGEVEMSTIFDAEFLAEKVGDMSIRDTKYSEYKLTAVGRVKLDNVFDDDYRIAEIGSLEASNSKYTEYRVQQLGSNFNLGQSFDDTVELEQVSAGFSYIGFDGKYTEMTVSIADGAQFQLDVDMKYGKVKYPEKRVEMMKYLEKDNQTVVQANVGSPQTSGKINSLKMRGFDNTLEWRN